MKVDVVSVVVLLFCFLAAVGAGAYAQDEDYVENKPLLELSPVVLAGGLPEGWQIRVGETGNADAAWLWEVAADGTAVVLMPGAAPLTLASPVLALEASCSAISGAVLGAGGNKVEARLQWMAGDAVVATVLLREPPISSTENRRFNLPESARPETANAAQLLMTVAPADNAPFRCASIRLSGTFSEKRTMSLFYNRVGYDQIGSKRFTAYSNFSAHTATFVVSDVTGVPVYNGELTAATRIQGAEGIEWNGYYYRGDFSALEQEGEYTITITLDDQTPVSAPIRIGFQLLWREAFAPVLAPFKKLRVDADPASTTLHLWETTYLGDTTEAALLWDLVRSWSILQGRFRDDPAFTPLQEEVLYGLEKVAQRVAILGNAAENDLVGQTFYATSLACGTHHYPESSVIREAAQQLAGNLMVRNLEGILPFSTVMDMFAATKDQKYFDYAQQIFPGISLHRVESLLAYEGQRGASVSIQLNSMFNSVAERILKRADNPFGIAQSVTEGQRGFFLWPPESAAPLKGSNPRMLAAAEIMAQAYRYAASPDKRDFVYDQLNWLLGNNPFGACLIAGLCENNAPHVALPEGMAAADVQGFVLHGIGPRNANEDYPMFATTADAVDESTNGVSLYNNARYISAMAYLNRIPVTRPL